MEIVLLLVVVAVGTFWYLNTVYYKKKPTDATDQAPYKVETPTPAPSNSTWIEGKAVPLAATPEPKAATAAKKTKVLAKPAKPLTPAKVKKPAKSAAVAKSSESKKPRNKKPQ